VELARVWLRDGRAEARREWEIARRLRRRGLPRRPLESLVDVSDLHLRIACPGRYASQDIFGMTCLAAIAASRRPRKVLEIGTFRGATAWILAANAPEATVYTLDLPPDAAEPELPVGPIDREIMQRDRRGLLYEGTPEADRIVQLRGDSATFDFDVVGPDIDLAFIDGAHSYEYVRNDTEKVLPRMRPGGTIVWDDYWDPFPGVVRYLDRLADRGLVAIVATRLAVWTDVVPPKRTVGHEAAGEGRGEAAVTARARRTEEPVCVA